MASTQMKALADALYLAAAAALFVLANTVVYILIWSLIHG